MLATDDLRAEHEGILRMLAVLEAMAGKLGGPEAPPPAQWEAVLEFLRVFADKCHHGKEEDVLFPALEKAGMPRQLHAAFRVAVEVARETHLDGEDGDRDRYRRRMIERILTQYEDLAVEDVDYLLGKLGNMARAA